MFQPALLAFTGGLALVLGRALAGPGGAISAAMVNIALSGFFALFVGPVLGQATPHFSTYVPAALCVEVAALIVSPRRLGAFVALAGVLIGTVGTLGEWAWTHVWMPIPWPAHFVPSAVSIGVPAALAGGLLGAFVAGSLAPRRVGTLGGRRWMPGAVGLVGFAAILAFCLPTHPPAGARATITLERYASSGNTRTAAAVVRIDPASVVSKPDYVEQLSWQGHAKSIVAVLHPIAPGVYRTAKPLPISGNWKSLIRMQQGRVRGDVPVFMPADPAIPAIGIPARASVTRAFVSDTTLMQRERKKDVPGWLWSTATSVTLAIIAVLLVIIGWGLNRVATLVGGSPPPGVSRSGRRRWVTRGAPAAAGAGR